MNAKEARDDLVKEIGLWAAASQGQTSVTRDYFGIQVRLQLGWVFYITHPKTGAVFQTTDSEDVAYKIIEYNGGKIPITSKDKLAELRRLMKPKIKAMAAQPAD